MSEIKETTARTWGLPEEPEIGTRVRDVTGLQWYRPNSRMWTRSTQGPWLTWEELVFSHGPLTEVPAPELPTEDGALIIASGKIAATVPFENKPLIRRESMRGVVSWYGAVGTGVTHTDEITSWTEAVAVPKDKLDALREALNNGSGQAIDAAAEALLETVDGRQA